MRKIRRNFHVKHAKANKKIKKNGIINLINNFVAKLFFKNLFIVKQL